MRRNRTKNNLKDKINIFKLLSILLAFLFLILIPAGVKKLIIIKNIVCVTQYRECPEEITKNFHLQSGKDLKTLKKEIGNNLINNYLVQSHLIQYKIPSTLKIEIVVKKPKFALFNGNENIYYLIDKYGVVIEKINETNLAYIADNKQFALGDKIDNELLFSVMLINKLDWLYSIKKGEIKNKSMHSNLIEGPVVIFPLEGDVDVLTGALRLIYSRLNEKDGSIRIENVSEIDLRYKNPIIR